MYQLLRRPEGRPWATPGDWLALPASDPLPAERSFVLLMRENRSTLGSHERQTIAILGTCLTILAVLPALKGYWLVPVFSLGVLALLVFALDRHRQSAPASETLELGQGKVVLRRSRQMPIELSPWGTQFAADQRSPANLRLFLRHRQHSIEIGACLSLEEREAIAPIIAAALAQARRS